MRQVPRLARTGTDDSCAAFTEVADTGQGPWLTLDTRVAGDRTTVTVCGELDIDVDQELRRALNRALNRSARGIDLDLSGVVFCDCSGLNTLLTVRIQARRQRKTVTIRHAGRAVHRILTLTGTLHLFCALDGADGTELELRTEVVQLRRAMQTRPTIDLARGILMAAYGLTPEDAWSALVMTSQHTNAKLHRVAQGLVDTVSGTSLPETVQEALSDVLAKVGTAQDAQAGPRP